MYVRGSGRGRRGMRGEFQGQGYRLTIAREAIFAALQTSEEHLGADEIYRKVLDIHPNIGLATVYRNLEIMLRMGLICRIDFPDGKARYRLFHQGIDTGHIHLICKNCNCVIEHVDLDEEEKQLINNMSSKLKNKYRFDIENNILNFYGLCKDCRE